MEKNLIGIPASTLTKRDRGEIGKTGLNEFGGILSEEFLIKLRDNQGRRIWREMRDNDPTVGAMMQAVESLVRRVTWKVVPYDSNIPEAVEGAAWLHSNMEDMDHTWADFLSEVITMFTFGFQWTEVVLKKREGPFQTNPQRRSKFSDGKIGIKKLAPRSQESLFKWEIDDVGTVLGFWQQPPTGGQTVLIPIEKSLHFKTTSVKLNPEGRSMLRNAFRPWNFMKRAEEFESIGIERELAGLPVVHIPKEYLEAKDDGRVAIRNEYIKIARDLKYNEQGSLILPSDTYPDKDGNPTDIPLVKVELMSASGSRAIDTNTTILRYQQTIARTILADFLVLGSGSRGSFSLSKDKSTLFMMSLQSQVDNIAATLNSQLITKLWIANGFNHDLMPMFVPGKVAPVDLDTLGNYVNRLAGAGIMFAGDEDTENVLRGVANLPQELNLDGQ